MELTERLDYIRHNNKIKPDISEYEFAKMLNTYPAKFAEIKSGKVKKLSQDIALEISKIFNVEFLWILTGEGNIFKSNSHDDNFANIPKYGDVLGSLGKGKEVFSEEVTEYIPFPKILFKRIAANAEYCSIINTSGASMQPTIIGGEDMVMIDSSQTEVFDGKIYLIRVENSLFVKRLQKLPKRQLKVISDNPEYDSYILDLNDESLNFAIIGRVVWISRPL